MKRVIKITSIVLIFILIGALVCAPETGYAIRVPIGLYDTKERISKVVDNFKDADSIIKYQSSDKYVGFTISGDINKKVLIDKKLYWLLYIIIRDTTVPSNLDYHLLLRLFEAGKLQVPIEIDVECVALAQKMPEEFKLWTWANEYEYIPKDKALFLHPPYIFQLLDVMKFLKETNKTIEEFVEDNPVDVLDLGNGKFWILQGQHRAFLCFIAGKPVKARIARIKSGEVKSMMPFYFKQGAFKTISEFLEHFKQSSLDTISDGSMDIAQDSFITASDFLEYLKQGLSEGQLDFKDVLQLLNADIDFLSNIGDKEEQRAVITDKENDINTTVINFDDLGYNEIMEEAIKHMISPHGSEITCYTKTYSVFKTMVNNFEIGQEFSFKDFLSAMGTPNLQEKEQIIVFFNLRLLEISGWVKELDAFKYVRIYNPLQNRPDFNLIETVSSSNQKVKRELDSTRILSIGL